ncbi:hypothetical protein ACYZT4_05470 [Pseudomonas sp. GB2N2]
MAGNSLAQILNKMKVADITEKWGGVLAFGQAQVNNLLRQQWLEKYDGRNFVPVFSGQIDLNEAETETGILSDVLLGNPLLSFEPAALDNSRAVLTFSLLGGSFTASEQTTGVMYSYEIKEAQGFTLKIILNLELAVGAIDRMGRVTLDLSNGVEFACNLTAQTASQKKIGEYFKARFNELPIERRVYELGWLDLRGGGDLTPTNFIILTQRAPGADQPGAPNAGDGAVVVLLKLRGSSSGGGTPSKDYFPYLIPDDLENGLPKYSATMVLAQEYISRSDDEKLELIQSVLFPGERNVFVEYSRHTPRDMVIFGALAPSKTALVIEPAVHSAKAGGSPVPYKAYRNGVPVNDVKWSVKSLNTVHSSGAINELTGVYTPVSAALIGKNVVRNIVSATWVEPANGEKPATTHRVSALLLVTPEIIAVSPGCVPRQVGGPSVTFVATGISGSNFTWSQPAFGTLVPQGNTAVYTPPKQELPEHLQVEEIQVSDGAGGIARASVVLSNFPTTMRIEPAFVSSLARSATVELKEFPGQPLPGLERKWEVIGEGSVDRNGVFKAPAHSTRAYSVVKCDIYYDEDILVRTGYSIINLYRVDEEPGWSSLTKFSLTALRSEKVYSNGFQQVPIEIRMETDGERMTPEQELSVRFYYLGSRQQVAEVPVGQVGIPFDRDNPLLWAQSSEPNTFTPWGGTLDEPVKNPATAPVPNVFTMYLVTRAGQVTEFFASVLNPDGLSLDSDTHPGNPDGRIKVTPVESPKTSVDFFTFKRRRIEGGGIGDPANGENEEDFDNFLKTLDYYDLEYKQDGQRAMTFVELELAEGSRQSSVLWESTHANEQMFSHLGYAYNHPRKTGDRDVMHHDSLIKANPILKVNLDTTVKGGVAEGRLLFSLFRRTDVRQDEWRGQPGNKDLHPLRGGSIDLILTDNQGHRQPIKIGFRDGNRNRLRVIDLPE